MPPSLPPFSATEATTSDDERRQYARIGFNAPAQLLLDGQTSAVVVLDLSLKGALVSLAGDTAPPIGASCQLRVELAETDGQIRMDARVTHVGDGKLGLACEVIDIDSVTHLRRLIELNLGDPALLERELSALIAG